jgi:hypothetical protein
LNDKSNIEDAFMKETTSKYTVIVRSFHRMTSPEPVITWITIAAGQLRRKRRPPPSLGAPP